MKSKKKENKKNINNEVTSKPSIEYSTEELIELGKKLNVLKLARPLYEENNGENEDENKDEG